MRAAPIHTERWTEKRTGMTKLHRRFLRLYERTKKFKIRTHSAIIPALAVTVITLYVYENLKAYGEKILDRTFAPCFTDSFCFVGLFAKKTFSKLGARCAQNDA